MHQILRAISLSVGHVSNLAVYVVLGVILTLSLITSGITAHAQAECQIVDKINIADIFIPAKFVPVVPEDCAQNEDGSIRALNLSVLPDVLINLFGALCSLIFYLLMLIVTFSGIQYMYSTIDGGQPTQALRNLQDAVIGVVTVLAAFIIINSLVTVLNIDNTVLDQDLASFFTPI